MPAHLIASPAEEMELMSRIWAPNIRDNPANFVKYIFPWGKPGTPLENYKGPRQWQLDDLQAMAGHIADNQLRIDIGEMPEVWRAATVAGRGPGKSARLAWLILWMMSCQIGSTTIVTANTESQLKTKTWAELGKWHTLALNSHWFERGALSLRPAVWFEQRLKDELKIDTGYYYAQAQLWSEDNPDAFAGAHNPLGVCVIYDEASGIPKPIWTVTEGFFTEPVLHRYWCADGNGRRNTGAFFECFHKDRNLWRTRKIDSRTVEGIDTTVLQSIITKHGADSDEARVEVYGDFPHQGDKQFISRKLIGDAQSRELQQDAYAPLRMGVDVARYGNDMSVIRFMRGRDARTIPPMRFKGIDNMQLAHHVAGLAEKYHPDGIFIDAGNGTGVIDRLREMKYKVHEVWFGAASPEPEYANFGTYMWAMVREWLAGGCIDPLDNRLADDLANREYKYKGSVSDVVQLESKEDLKRRGFDSPDDADALAVMFAKRLPRLDGKTTRRAAGQVASGMDNGMSLS